eukprot:330594-Chlamydomonas_euryale.AAC.13
MESSPAHPPRYGRSSLWHVRLGEASVKAAAIRLAPRPTPPHCHRARGAGLASLAAATETPAAKPALARGRC